MSTVSISEILTNDDCVSDSKGIKGALYVSVCPWLSLCVMYQSKGGNQIMSWMSGPCQTLILVTSV